VCLLCVYMCFIFESVVLCVCVCGVGYMCYV